VSKKRVQILGSLLRDEEGGTAGRRWEEATRIGEGIRGHLRGGSGKERGGGGGVVIYGEI